MGTLGLIVVLIEAMKLGGGIDRAEVNRAMRVSVELRTSCTDKRVCPWSGDVEINYGSIFKSRSCAFELWDRQDAGMGKLPVAAIRGAVSKVPSVDFTEVG